MSGQGPRWYNLQKFLDVNDLIFRYPQKLWVLQKNFWGSMLLIWGCQKLWMFKLPHSKHFRNANKTGSTWHLQSYQPFKREKIFYLREKYWECISLTLNIFIQSIDISILMCLLVKFICWQWVNFARTNLYLHLLWSHFGIPKLHDTFNCGITDLYIDCDHIHIIPY